MDLRHFYRKIKETADSIVGEFVIVASHETPDGGRAGILTEVTRMQAAKLVVEGRARVATPEEVAQYHKSIEQQVQRLAKESAAAKVQVAIFSDETIAALAARPKGKRTTE